MRSFSLSLSLELACLAASITGAFAQSVTSDAVGYLTLNVQGTGGKSSSALSFLGLSLSQPVTYQATFSSASGTALTDNSATWTDNRFNGANGNFYVELVSGIGTGTISQITATSGTNHSITTADDLSSYVASGTGYKIRPNWTLAGLFGTGTTLMINGGTATTADEVLVYSTKTQSYTIYYYKNGGLGGAGWRTTNDPSTDQSNTALLPSAGVIVKRLQSSSLTFPLQGAVKLGQTAIPIGPGLNLVGNVYPSGTLTLGNSDLVLSGFTGGTATSSDAVQVYDSAAGLYTTYYYKTGGLGGTGWRTTSDPSTDQSNTIIPCGMSIIVQRNQNRTSFNWIVPQPF